MVMVHARKSMKIIKIGTNWVAMARQGLILHINGATAGRMLLHTLPGRFDANSGSKKLEMLENPENQKIAYIFPVVPV